MKPLIDSTPPKARETNITAFLDTTVPNMARIFDYFLGGSTHFEADRQAADVMLKIMPSMRKWVRLRHAFVQEAAQILHREGFVQFLDIGSGIPVGDHIHASLPDVRVVYSDINPVAVSYGSSLFADLDNVAYVFGDVRDLQSLLTQADVIRLIDAQQKVAIGLNALMLFLPRMDIARAMQTLYEWAAVGSKVFVVFQTRQDMGVSEGYYEILRMSATAGFPIQLYTLEECLEMIHPWHLSHIESVTDFLGLPPGFVTDEDRTEIGMLVYAVFLAKESE